MKPEEQRIAIAKACGYKLTALAQNPSQRTWQYGGATIELPDYLNDLNAMHEAEKFVKNVWGKYVKTLNSFTDPACATATQRAEAFLRTLHLYTP